MNNLFNNIIVTAPNGGGIFFLHENNAYQIDNFNTTGIDIKADDVVRGLQPSTLKIYNTKWIDKTKEINSLEDIHDVYVNEQSIYIVGTLKNEIIQLDHSGKELQRWVFPGEKDSLHINCLTKWNEGIVFSAFGDFSEHRGYKGKTDRSGYVQDLNTGKRLITDLSQPHSLVPYGKNLLLANSEKNELLEFDKNGNILRRIDLHGYTRGLFIAENIIYVGLSCSRNSENITNKTAAILALDLSSWQELGRINLPVQEIYAIQGIASPINAISVLAKISENSNKKYTQIIDDQNTEIKNSNKLLREKISDIENLNKAIFKREEQIKNLNENLIERNSHISDLNQKISERGEQLSSFDKIIIERDLRISNLNQTILEQDQKNKKFDKKITEQDRSLANLQEETVVKNKDMLDLVKVEIKRQAAHQAHITELENAVEKEQKINALHTAEVNRLLTQMDEIFMSRSWRYTKWLRCFITFLKSPRESMHKKLISIYRNLPIRPKDRIKIKNLAFKYFGFIFAKTTIYQQWAQYRAIQTNWPKVNAGIPELINSKSPINMIAALPNANGIWEWQDYRAVESRISQIKENKRSQASPQKIDLIDLGKESLDIAASRINFIESTTNPIVSIIIPTFNNIKLTLECLISIEKNTDYNIAFEIIIADDASTDETVGILKSIKNITVLQNKRNLGFLLNCNNALKHVRGDYLIFLNNDVQVTSGWLTALLNTFTLNPKVGAVGPRFIYPSGHLQEAGAAFRSDGTADMIGLNEEPSQPRFSYTRRVDYVSGACLMLPTFLARKLGGFSEEFLPCYCEDGDLCLKIQEAGYYVYYNPTATIVHHLSKTTAATDSNFKMRCITNNTATLKNKWKDHLEKSVATRLIAFYLPQFHPIPENNKWWGNGFTEWTNVSKAIPNFLGHYQPRIPADLGYYDLRLTEVMEEQAELARRYGVSAFCFYYYWFDGKRLLDRPIEQMLETQKPDFPFCLCWANENWTRRWDGQENEVLIAQAHSAKDDELVIMDLIRYFRDARYIRIDGRPLILIYRVTLFPNFAETANLWRDVCRKEGVGEIYIAMVESFDLVHANTHPREFGCDSAVEFPPQGLAEQKPPSGEVINPNFSGSVADYRDLAVRYATRDLPAYTRFSGVIPGWDNSARRQNNSFCFEHATPGAFQAWLEESIQQTRFQHYGDERLVFINAWNEWAEGAYLEPDRRFGHSYLEAVKNAVESPRLLRKKQ